MVSVINLGKSDVTSITTNHINSYEKYYISNITKLLVTTRKR